ncbi:hypothetical protein [Paraburkholderia sp. SG-MS1]|uniref:hypothetical protein n=1 Tax=Paraburkholderia sp. SG-MS1 TaxID=2023741 RepID=UPI001445143D|nr:hypothetical protein [Paraburkholderia sp. SG-MS1]
MKVDTAALLLDVGIPVPETFHETFQETTTVFCHEQPNSPPRPNPLIIRDNRHGAANGTLPAK